MIDGFKQKNIGFKSITERMDAITPHGEFLLSVFGDLAQYEQALTKEHIMAGLQSAKKRGKQEEDQGLSHLKKCKQLVKY